jgi:ankyrin repeat protein
MPREADNGSALQAAAYHSHQHAKILIEHGADVNQRGGRFGSPLQAAKAKGVYRVVKLLLENGAEDDGEGRLSSSKVEYPEKPSIYLWLA